MISRQAPSTVRTAMLERECLRLRAEGLSHRAIARQLHIAPSTAYKRVAHALQELHRSNAEQAVALRELEALRLDEMQDAIWEQALDGDLHALDRILAIMARRSKLLGLDAAETKPERSAPDADPAFRYQFIVKQLRAELMGL
jgi:DNA-binding CsgD family transcriptional regulator